MFAKLTQKHSTNKLVLSALILITTACDMDKSEPRVEPLPISLTTNKLLVASSKFYGADSIAYNSNNTPKWVKIKDPGYLVSINYSQNLVTHVFNRFGKTFAKNVYELENGIAKKSTFYSVDNTGKENEMAHTFYSYKAGKLSKEAYYPVGQPHGFFNEYLYDDTNENVIAKNMYYKEGKLVQKTSFEYTTIPDKSGFINQWTLNMDGNLFPRKSNYLIKSQTTQVESSKVFKVMFTYELDAQGYVIRGKRVSSNGLEWEEEWTNRWSN